MTAKLTLVQDDITRLQVDAIVNAANTSLLGGSGVDGAIHRAAGAELKNYCVTLGGCQTGQAKLSPAFNLPSQYVIHAVGPVWHGGTEKEPELLADCYRNSLYLAAQQGIRSLAFPAISCGVYAYPVAKACDLSIDIITQCCVELPDIRKVILCAFNDNVYQHWLTAFSRSHIH